MAQPKTPGQRLLEAALTLGSMAAMTWLSLPEHSRGLWKMRASLTASRWLNNAARRAGQGGMAAELRAGRPASEHYQTSYMLAVARDACARAYQRSRSGGAG